MASISASNNNTLELFVADRYLNLRNGTLIYLQTKPKFQDTDLNELLYVVVVIMFYATALMVLIATQIKRSKREGSEVDYYDEYLQRNTAIYQKKQMQQKMMQKVEQQKLAAAAAAAATASRMASNATCAPSYNLNANSNVNTVTNLHTNNTSTVQLESIPDEDV